ncbi:MAG: hypothetical protein KatS3mg115_1581 [Candidatus Poribacteria bacterium]|nr:MAG: hypothetical protein KatS3mg115_1581 [Candidatus Poribacteria bacterium]
MNLRVRAVQALIGTVPLLAVFGQQSQEGAPAGFLPSVEESSSSTAPPLDFTQAALNVFIALILVLVVVVLLAVALKRLSYRMRQTGGGEIRILAQLPIGPSQQLTVVEIAGEVLVLGVTEHSVTALAEIDDVQTIQRLRAQEGVPSASLGRLPSFREWLRRAQQGPVGKS